MKTYALTGKLKTFVKNSVPGYRKRTVWIWPINHLEGWTISECELQWSGGSKSSYKLVTSGGRLINFCNAETVFIGHNCFLIKDGVFCGKPSMLTIYGNAEDIKTYLGIELSE